MIESVSQKTTLCDRDFVAWTEQQAERLRSRQWKELDIENLAEEIEALGRSEQRELGSYLQVLLMHLLKCEDQPERKTSSWDNSIANCRDSIQDCIEDSPSLQRFLQDSEWIEKYYRRTRRAAAKETQKPLDAFSVTCPYLIEQILDSKFSF